MPVLSRLGEAVMCDIKDVDGCSSLADTTCSQAVAITQVQHKSSSTSESEMAWVSMQHWKQIDFSMPKIRAQKIQVSLAAASWGV